jgi:putative two-component system response regulator
MVKGAIPRTESHGMHICVIDDNPVNLAVLRGILSKVADWVIEAYGDPATALSRCQVREFDLVVTDYQMPGINGIELIERLRRMPDYHDIPIIVITGDSERTVRLDAIRAGATDFLTRPVDPEELRVRATNLLALRRSQKALADRALHLADEVAAATRAISAREEEIVTRLARAIEYRDDNTGDHILRVANVSRLLGKALEQPPQVCRNLFLAAQLHDMGKIGLPDTILLKRGRLTPAEIVQMQLHTLIGGAVLSDGTSDLIRMSHDIAVGHHERWDGQGYPRQLSGEDIPLVARIVAVADVLDALCSVRPYKGAWPANSALEEIERGAGSAFDPVCVAALRRIWPQVSGLYVNSGAEDDRITA